jgi:hypothetical protein
MNRTPAMRTISIIFKIVLALVVLSGVITALVISTTTAEVLNTFAYFTIQSNLIVLGVAVYGAIRLLAKKPEGRLAVIIRNGATLWILITGLVFHFMLGGLFRFTGGMAWLSISLHYISPVMVILNWLLFEEKGKSRYIHTVYWMIYPIAYAVFSVVRFAIDGFAPYWFLNPVAQPPAGTGGVAGMLGIIAAMVAFFGLMGILIIRIDRIWKKKAEAAVKAGPA